MPLSVGPQPVMSRNYPVGSPESVCGAVEWAVD